LERRPSLKSALIWIADNLEAVQTWRAQLSPERRADLNNPEWIKRIYRQEVEGRITNVRGLRLSRAEESLRAVKAEFLAKTRVFAQKALDDEDWVTYRRSGYRHRAHETRNAGVRGN
jgi:hypothetical protein